MRGKKEKLSTGEGSRKNKNRRIWDMRSPKGSYNILGLLELNKN